MTPVNTGSVAVHRPPAIVGVHPRPRRVHASRRLRPSALALLLAFVGLCAFAASPASAVSLHVFSSAFGEPGKGVGQLEGPAGIAVNEESGNVYVVDRGNARVQEFTAAGVPFAQFDGAAAPTGPLENPKDIAIDNSGNPFDPSESDVYVSGEVTVAGEPVQVIYKFSEAGTYLGQITTGSGGAPFRAIFGVGVDGEGTLWVYQPSAGGVVEVLHYTGGLENELAGSCEDAPASGASGFTAAPGFAVDSEDNLYVNTGDHTFARLNGECEEQRGFRYGRRDGGLENDVAGAVDVAGGAFYTVGGRGGAQFPPGSSNEEFVKPVSLFGIEEVAGEADLLEAAGVAANAASAEKLVYVSDRGSGQVKVYREVVRPTVLTGASSSPTPTSIVVAGSVNPEGVPVESCVFEYGETTGYGKTAPCEQEPGSGEVPVSVSATLSGLVRNTTFHYRLTASNTNGATHGLDATFIVGPELLGNGVSDVSGDAATFQASLNPHGVATSVYYQYGTTTGYGTDVPAAPGALVEPVEGEVQATAEHVVGLTADTTYHYRAVLVAAGETFPGPDKTFTTQSAPTSSGLLDGRGWELVSPPEKHSAQIEAPGGQNGLAQAATDGSAFSYVANAPTEASSEANDGLVQVLSAHSAGGWSSKDIASPHGGGTTGQGASNGPEYTLFSEKLSVGLIQPWGLFEPALSEEASEQTPYLRTLGGCASGCYRPLVTAKAGHANALPGFGEELLCEEENGGRVEVVCGPRVLGASPNLGHVVLLSAAPLRQGAGREQLYEWSGGTLSQVSLLPKNEAGEEPSAPDGQASFGVELGLNLGGRAVGAVKRAISADGRRVFWAAAAPGAVPTLYVRDTVRGETLELDTAEPACVEEGRCQNGGGRFQIASADGSAVLFTDARRLTKDANPGGDLYECKLRVQAGKLVCDLTDLTPEAGGEPEVEGSVLGAGEDLSTVYFVGTGALNTAPNARGQSPVKNQPNLYMRRNGTTSFIATLSGGDERNWAGHDEIQPARVSSNGRWLAFMSERPLTGYDNRDAVSGKPDAEIYEYNAENAQLSCASCNPSGARPHGMRFGQLLGGEAPLGDQSAWARSGWVAAFLPGSTSFGNGSAYQTRSLSDSGRVFFNDLDPLLPQDVNSNWDVYEYEPEGVGSCAPGTTGFTAEGQGCQGLISSGASDRQSALMDTSRSGSDVFFLTAAKLTGHDIDDAFDVYDAHECSSGWACPAPEPAAPPPCATEGSCRPAPVPQPGVFAPPSSSTFSGPGNQHSTSAGTTPRKPTAAQQRAAKLKKALKACRKLHRPAKRKACERTARRRFGPATKAHNSISRRSR